MDEFKEFLKTIPSLKQDVLNGRYNRIFGIIFGEDDDLFL